MFKAVVDVNAKPVVLHLGLSYANILRMRKDDPIVFNLKELGLSSHWVALSYKHDNGKAAFPLGFKGIGLAFSNAAIRAMKRGHPQRLETDDFVFVVFAGKSEQSMVRRMRKAGLIGSQTISIHRGFPPSEIPPAEN